MTQRYSSHSLYRNSLLRNRYEAGHAALFFSQKRYVTILITAAKETIAINWDISLKVTSHALGLSFVLNMTLDMLSVFTRAQGNTTSEFD